MWAPEEYEELSCESSDELIEVGRRLAASCQKGTIICLFGDLGAGKTTFVKGIAEGLRVAHADQVQSPTFTYLHVYEGALPLYHFDLYRLHNSEEFLAMGFDEYLFGAGVSCIEWSERIADLLPNKRIEIVMSVPHATKRHLSIRYVTYD